MVKNITYSSIIFSVIQFFTLYKIKIHLSQKVLAWFKSFRELQEKYQFCLHSYFTSYKDMFGYSREKYLSMRDNLDVMTRKKYRDLN